MFHFRISSILFVFGLLAFYPVISSSTSFANDKLIKGAFDIESGYSVKVRIVHAGDKKLEMFSSETGKWYTAKKSGRGYVMTVAGQEMFSADGGSGGGDGGGC